MLSYMTVRGTLSAVFPRKTVNDALAEMAGVGMVKRGPGAPFSPHNACVAMLACGLPEADASRALAAAKRMRDWAATAPGPGRKTAPGHLIAGLSDVKVIRTMIAEIMCKQPVGWSMSPVEVVGHGLAFGPRDGEVPERIKRENGSRCCRG
jgi:hypothetical protein